MRPYRGITKDGTMIYGWLVKIGDTPYIASEPHFSGFTGGKILRHEIWGFREVTPESLGQFTGRKDKNGTEIYDGSVVTVYFGDLPSTLKAIAQIIYLQNECRFVAKGIGKDKGKGPWTIDPKRMEIIHQHLSEQDNG